MLQVRGTAICGSVFAVVLLCGTLAYGQNTAGTILGAVSDESGARLPGVTVTITHLDTGIVRSVTTDEAGRYRAPALGLGNYEVKAELTGFRTVPAGTKLGTPDLYFDPCAFALPEAGFYGNLGRNTVIGPGLAHFDFAVVKNT